MIAPTVARVLPEYDEAVAALAPVLHGRPPVIVAIDGRDGVGKTTLGRYLAWHFNCTLLETDSFPPFGRGVHLHKPCIAAAIRSRVELGRPILIEGISILRVLSSIAMKPNFLLYVRNETWTGSEALRESHLQYEKEFQPESKADRVITLNHDL